MIPWIKKYQPKSLIQVIGQTNSIGKLGQFIDSYSASKSKKKIAIVYGGIGNGKTSSVHALAHDKGFELFEINSSDFRNKEGIDSTVGVAIKQRSLFFKGKIILVDEIDGLSGQKDRGGIQALTKLLEEASFPVICTAQDPFDKKFSDLTKKAVMIEFVSLEYTAIANCLIEILQKENCVFNEAAVKVLARRSGGDLRAAINDAQVITASGVEPLTIEAVKELDSHERARTQTLMHALHIIFKTTDANTAMEAFDSINDDIDEVGQWIVHNIPKEYHGADLAQAFEWISRADVLQGRIMRWQHWRFLSYIIQLYSAGVATAKGSKYPGMIEFERPSRGLKIWILKNKFAKRSAVAAKIASKTHTSTSRVIHDVMPFISYMCKHDSKILNAIATEYDLSDDELDWFRK